MKALLHFKRRVFLKKAFTPERVWFCIVVISFCVFAGLFFVGFQYGLRAVAQTGAPHESSVAQVEAVLLKGLVEKLKGRQGTTMR